MFSSCQYTELKNKNRTCPFGLAYASMRALLREQLRHFTRLAIKMVNNDVSSAEVQRLVGEVNVFGGLLCDPLNSKDKFIIPESLDIVKYSKFSGCYTKDELTLYLESFRAVVGRDAFPVLMLESTLSAMTIAYFDLHKEWIVISSHNKTVTAVYDDESKMAEDIVDAFSDNSIAALTTSIYAKYSNKLQVIHAIAGWVTQDIWKFMHTPTIDTIDRFSSFNETWLMVAARCGDLLSIRQLKALNAEQYQPKGSYPPLLLAHRMNQVAAFNLLSNMDSIAVFDGETPKCVQREKTYSNRSLFFKNSNLTPENLSEIRKFIETDEEQELSLLRSLKKKACQV